MGAAGAAADPQQLNRYSYVGNNPITGTDPSGHCIGVLAGIDTLACIGLVVVITGAVVAITASQTGFNPNDYDWTNWSIPGLSSGMNTTQSPQTTAGIPLAGEEKGSNINAAKQSKQSAKEGATDVPQLGERGEA